MPVAVSDGFEFDKRKLDALPIWARIRLNRILAIYGGRAKLIDVTSWQDGWVNGSLFMEGEGPYFFDIPRSEMMEKRAPRLY
jgi:hypothetical protein